MSNVIDFGTPRPEFDNWEVFTVRFHGFDTLTTPAGQYVSSPSFTCCEREWKVRLYPNGMVGNASDIAVFLELISGEKITFGFNMWILDAKGKISQGKKSIYYDHHFADQAKKCGWKNFWPREKIIDPLSEILNHGTLTIEVRMKPSDANYCKNFIPENPFNSSMLKLFGDEESADVVFEVKGSNDCDKPSTSTQFYAHKIIMKACAPTLAALCEPYDKSTPVPIPNVKPGIFRKLLRYVYGEKVPTTEWKEHAKDFVDAADRYGVVTLKLEAEVQYTKHFKITMENIVETLSYADAKNCALLKEAAMKFAVKNANEVITLDSFGSMPNSLSIMKELFTVYAMSGSDGSDSDANTMSIGSLRMKLHEKGLDIDGSREMLIARLKK